MVKIFKLRIMKMMQPISIFVGFVLAMGIATQAFADQTNARLDQLFDSLSETEVAAEATPIAREIWRVWGLPRDSKASVPLAQGVIHMSNGEFSDARSKFDQVIAIAPDFAEGWNKRATVAYMQGDFDTSVHDIQKTLALEPRHFGALSGLALIYENLGKHETALDIMLQVKEIYPGMPGIDNRMLDLRNAIKAKRT